jgi:hypothetical protein
LHAYSRLRAFARIRRLMSSGIQDDSLPDPIRNPAGNLRLPQSRSGVLELQSGKPRVKPVPGNEFRMGALFDDSPLVDDHDAVAG